MKNLYLPLLLVFLLITSGTQAKIWRVNNNVGVGADFTTLQEAHDAAAEGDTIHVEPSMTQYAGITVYKKLCFVGYGYFLATNPGLQAANVNANVGHLIFANQYETTSPYNLISSSGGSKITGLELTQVTTRTSNIFISRCKVSDIRVNQNIISNGTYTNISNIFITQCYVSGTIFINPEGTNSGLYRQDNIIITNNIIGANISMGSTSSGTVENNVSLGTNMTFNNAIVRNNILVKATSVTGENNTINNNLLANAVTFSANNTVSNNQFSVDMTQVFVADPTATTPPAGYTTESRWQLKTGSPAINAGADGTDAGAFGGSTPYVYGGIPAIPSIYSLEVPASGSGSLQVQMKVRSNK